MTVCSNCSIEVYIYIQYLLIIMLSDSDGCKHSET